MMSERMRAGTVWTVGNVAVSLFALRRMDMTVAGDRSGGDDADLSRRFVNRFPALSKGFDIVAELTIHALELRMPTVEVDVPYKTRPKGSQSKLHTYRDGFRICWTIFRLMKEERPHPFFAAIFLVLAAFSLCITIPVFRTYLETGYVPHFPTAILAAGTVILSFLSLACGLVLDTATLGRRQAKRMRYLEYPAAQGTTYLNG